MANIPESSEVIGLSVKLKRVFAKPPPINLIPEVRIFIPTRKTKRRMRTEKDS